MCARDGRPPDSLSRQATPGKQPGHSRRRTVPVLSGGRPSLFHSPSSDIWDPGRAVPGQTSRSRRIRGPDPALFRPGMPAGESRCGRSESKEGCPARSRQPDPPHRLPPAPSAGSSIWKELLSSSDSGRIPGFPRYDPDFSDHVIKKFLTAPAPAWYSGLNR